MTNNNNPTAALLDALFEPLGAFAPQKRWLLLDFKGPDGKDRNTSTYLYCPKGLTDETIIQALKKQISSEGGRLSAVSEIFEDEHGNQTGRCLYCAPGFLEESMIEAGLQVPDDMRAAMDAAGFHPLNQEELLKHES